MVDDNFFLSFFLCFLFWLVCYKYTFHDTVVCITTNCPNCERYITNYTSLTTSDVVDYNYVLVAFLALS